MSTTIPHLLEPYLDLPEETSLIVLSSILGASTNWLLFRYLHSYLKYTPPTSPNDDEPETAVLLVSFLRDYPFFQQSLAKLSLDLDSEAKKGRFLFVDGLSSLYLPAKGGAAIQNGDDLKQVQAVIEAGVTSLLQQQQQQQHGKKRRVVLVIDQPDFLVASTAAENAAMAVRDMMLDLREKVHSCVLTVSADDPLIHPSTTTPTPLETSHSWFVLSLIHEADMLCALRLLDTGHGKGRQWCGQIHQLSGEQKGG
ncbi:hypothetical protein QBC40DRAFT_254207 [Triangularia verruculosa]|uniref:Uncharacterized protein n=1 Tax=Triangularia verruculosa TaxID=2587418 RepID=A0AAN6XGM4_9PEZI|nr:hypothetical protein QBC40DRAFT_254207 [Triangularia verruculosa]